MLHSNEEIYFTDNSKLLSALLTKERSKEKMERNEFTKSDASRTIHRAGRYVVGAVVLFAVGSYISNWKTTGRNPAEFLVPDTIIWHRNADRDTAKAVEQAATLSTREHCGGVVPLNGTFNETLPPYYFPRPELCPIPRVFSRESFMRCMHDRQGRFFTMGNSFSRGFAFAMQQMLIANSTAIDRQSQKKICDKAAHSANDDQSCTLEIPIPSELQGIVKQEEANINFLWRGSFYNTSWQTDFCSGRTPTDCYRHFFKGESRPGDVLISNIGLGYVEHWRGQGTWKPYRLADAARDVANFLDSGIFKGTFIWTSVTLAHPQRNYGGFNPDMDAINAALVPVILARNGSIIYQRSFNQGLPLEQAYTDAIHPPVSHYMAVMYHAMAVACDGDKARASSMRQL